MCMYVDEANHLSVADATLKVIELQAQKKNVCIYVPMYVCVHIMYVVLCMVCVYWCVIVKGGVQGGWEGVWVCVCVCVWVSLGSSDHIFNPYNIHGITLEQNPVAVVEILLIVPL